MKKLLAIFVSTFIVNSCSDQSLKQKIYVGKISENFYEFVSKLEQDAEIVITSSGGEVEFGQKSAELILAKNISVKVQKLCASACAEYILPSASSIEFVNSPIIAFHGNPIMGDAMEQKYEKEAANRCFDDHAAKMKNLYIRTNHNHEFWKEQLSRLSLSDPVFERSKNCVQFQYVFEHKFWYPRSDQLKGLLGLKFKGDVCADSQECVESRIRKKWKRSVTFVVGDDISSGTNIF